MMDAGSDKRPLCLNTDSVRQTALADDPIEKLALILQAVSVGNGQVGDNLALDWSRIPPELAQSLQMEATNGDLQSLAKHLPSSRVPPLHFALKYLRADAPVIQELLKADPSAARLEMATDRGLFPLHKAAVDNDPEVVRLLLGACPESAAQQTKDKGHTPLSHALENLSRLKTPGTTLRLLLEAYPAAASGCPTGGLWKGYSPLHIAAKKKASLDVVQLLLEFFPDAASKPAETNPELFPLHLAVKSKAAEPVIRAIMEAHPAALNTRLGGKLPVDLCDDSAVQQLFIDRVAAMDSSALASVGLLHSLNPGV